MKDRYISKMMEEKFICDGLRLLHKKHLDETPQIVKDEDAEIFSGVEETLFNIEQRHRQKLIKYTKKAHRKIK